MTDWFKRRRIALEAWELGKKLMVPKPLRPVRPQRRPGVVMPTWSHLGEVRS